jgi:HEPN domain-containing protein
MSEPENQVETRTWLRYAKEDLQASQELAKAGINPRQVCFLAQQAAEKAIKAILIFCQIDFPKTHDVEVLINLVPRGWLVKGCIGNASILTEWAVEARYPGNWPEATEDEATSALLAAAEILQTVEGDLQLKGLNV